MDDSASSSRRTADSGASAAADSSAALDDEELAVLLKALAHPARIQLLRHLSSVGECYFGDLSEITGLAASTTSQHVKILREAGLVNGASQEQRVCYCVNKDRLNVLKRLVRTL